jgi:hypothetical protein
MLRRTSRRTRAGRASESEAACSRFFSAVSISVNASRRRATASSFKAAGEGGRQGTKGMRAANWRSTPASIRSDLLRFIIAWAKCRAARGLATINSTPAR